MKLIIFAGGIGTRFWPLARKDTPKQFHPILGDQTTLEHSFDTIKDFFNINDIYISTGKQYAQKIKELFPNIPSDNFIVEPTVKDTGPAVIYALLRIAQTAPDEPVVIRWQNSHISKPKVFLSTLNQANKIFSQKLTNLVYIGVPSRYPHTGVGYIHYGNKVKDLTKTITLHEFIGFKEKPHLTTAKRYHENGNFAWNPGCYITTPRFILNKLEEINPTVHSLLKDIERSLGKKNEWQLVSQIYENFPKKSVDYLIWEKLDPQDAKVVLADYGWSYVAAWNLLKDILDGDQNNNVLLGNNVDMKSKNIMVQNFETKKLVATINLKDMIIINTPEVVAVFNRDDSYAIKDLLTLIRDNGLDEYL